MRGKGHTYFEQSDTGKYLTPSLQVRWSYFIIGWEMCAAQNAKDKK